MTVSRISFAFALILSPLVAWGQTTPAARPDVRADGRNQFALEADAEAVGGAGVGIPPAGYLQGYPGPQPGMIGRPDGTLAPAISPQSSQAGIPPDAIRSRQQFQSPIWQTTSRGGYFAVIGAVARAGVYYQQTERALLNDVLKLAGGPTAEAGGGVRIVRQGRGGLQTYLSPNSRYELLTGDVVLLESNQRPGMAGLQQYSGKIHAISDSGEKPGEAKPPTNGSIYLAFVNLKSEPIVVPVPAAQATVTNVMTWLRQDLKAPPALRVIPPGPQLLREPRLPADQQLLENGTVLVFDPSTVKKDRLPEFPGALGEKPVPGTDAVPAVSGKAVPAQVPPDVNPRSQLPQLESPAGRATRMMPSRVPPPPTEPNLRPGPRRTVGQPESIPGEGQSATNGPALMLPQRPGDRNSHPADTDLDSRPNVAPANMEDSQTPESSANGPRPQRLSWQSRPDGNVSQVAAYEDEYQGIHQANAERILPAPDELAGPVLEMPRPQPQITAEPALIQPEVRQPAQATIAPMGSFSRRVIWFSLASTGLLALLLWSLLRWERVRPLRARALAGRTRIADAASRTNYKQRSVVMAERQQVFRTDITNPPAAAPPSTAADATPAETPSLPPPIGSISQREHALRAHFRQALKERGQRPPATIGANEVASEESAVRQVPAPLSTPPAPHSKSKLVQPSKMLDALSRALNAKRNDA